MHVHLDSSTKMQVKSCIKTADASQPGRRLRPLSREVKEDHQSLIIRDGRYGDAVNGVIDLPI